MALLLIMNPQNCHHILSFKIFEYLLEEQIEYAHNSIDVQGRPYPFNSSGRKHHLSIRHF